jgi:hypothetical protein
VPWLLYFASVAASDVFHTSFRALKMSTTLVESVVLNLHAGIVVGVLRCFKTDGPQQSNAALHEQVQLTKHTFESRCSRHGRRLDSMFAMFDNDTNLFYVDSFYDFRESPRR